MIAAYATARLTAQFSNLPDLFPLFTKTAVSRMSIRQSVLTLQYQQRGNYCPYRSITLCSHKSRRCAVELYHASHLWYPPFYTSPMASSALSILNRQPYEGRQPLTSWWRKSSNMTVGQSSLISLAHHCYD